MAHFLPAAIMNLFAPRPPIEFKPPIEKRKMPPYTGIAEFVDRFKNDLPLPVVHATKAELKEKARAKKKAKFEKRRERQIEKYRSWITSPPDTLTKDAYKTLFVARLAHSVTADDLKAEFSYYGPVRSVALIKNKLDASRGYAFIEFEHTADLTAAYKDADGRKIHGRRILVDVERGRTVKGWLPKRLGGGLGANRTGGPQPGQGGPAGAAATAAAQQAAAPYPYARPYGAATTDYSRAPATPYPPPSTRPYTDRSRDYAAAPPSSSYAPASTRAGLGYSSSSYTRGAERWEKGTELDVEYKEYSGSSSSKYDDRYRPSSSTTKPYSSSSSRYRSRSRSYSRSRSRSDSRHRSSHRSKRSRSYSYSSSRSRSRSRSYSHSPSRSRSRSYSRSRSAEPTRRSSSKRSSDHDGRSSKKHDHEPGELLDDDEPGEIKNDGRSSKDKDEGRERKKRKRSRSRSGSKGRSKDRSRSREVKSSRHR